MRQTSPFILSAAVAALLSSSSLATGQDADFSSIPSPLYHQQRGLEIGDFARFNEIFANAELVIPDDAIDVGDGGLIKFSISNLFCRNINLGDMVTGYTIQPSPTTGQDVLAYTVNVSPFAMTCEADYTFSVEGALSFLSLDGVGHFIATTENNAVTTQIDISGPSTFALEPPTAVVVSSCQANIETNGNIEFQGATYERLLETFKGIISNVVDERAGKAACDALSDVGPTMLGSLLNKTDVRIDAWLAPVSPDLADPLFAENNFVAPDGVTLVHFQKNSTDASVSDTFVKFLKEADALFGETVIDETTGESDLGINVLLRKTLVNETTGSWEINIAEVEGFDPIVFNSSDKLTESNIRIDGMKITGLDTLQTFNPFVDIGGYTVSNNLTWEKLSLEVDMTVDIKPSTRPDRILRAADNNVNVVENIKVKVDLSSLAVDLSIFMAIDKTRFEGLDLGSLLSTENVLPCFLSSMIALEVSGLDVTITNMSVPELDGFVSPGIDRVLSNLAQAAFAAYEPTLLRAIPGIFQGPVRKLLKTRVLNTVLKYGENADCPLLPALVDEYGDSALMDFRDLFLRPEEASALGGSGEAPYGNIGHVAYKLIIDRLSEEDDDGLPQINEMLVRRITAAQSGEEGTMRFPQTLFEFGVNSSSTGVQARSLQENKTTLNLIDGLSFSLGDIRVSNLDTIVNPMELLNMTGNPYVLRNSAGLGTDTERNITLTIRVAAGFNDEMNEIDLVASIESLSFLADISALMDANAFLKFPLGEVLNYNCWLAALQAVELDEFGFAINSTSRRSLAIEDFSTSISSFGISSNCITCVSPGAQLLSELLQIQKNVGAISTLENRIPSFLRSFAMSDTSQTYFDRLVADASNLCPSSPTYSPEAVRTKYDAVGFPALSGESIDTLLFSGVIAAEVAFVMLAETQRSIDVTPSNPLSAQEAFIAPEGVRLLDWTDIGNSTGLSNIADEIFSQARTFLSGEGGNMFDFKTILEGLLGDDGVLEIDTDFKFERDNILLAVDLVRVKGLDSFTLFDVFVPIGPQTLSSSVEFDTLELEMVLSASIPKSTIPPQAITAKFAFQNVSADVALFAAFDLDKIGNLKIGSLLETRSLIKCILSAAHLFDIPQLKVSLGSFSNPTVDGLFPDTAPSAKLSIDTVFNRFRSEIEEAIPIIFDGVGKQMIARLLDSADEKSCGQPLFGSSQPGFVDFRDLLLPKQMSVLLGGSGMAQYGNLVSKVYTLLSDELFAPDEVTGLAAINRRLISKLGESQSGTPGRFLFSGDVISGGKQIQAGGLDADVSFRVYDAYINNLDTFGIPMTVLDPVQGDGQSLNNSISMGLNRSLQLGTRFFFGLSGDETFIENDLDIMLDMDTLSVLLTGLVTVSEQAFLQFPIRDVANLQCWLATIPVPQLDARGVRVDRDAKALSVSRFAASVTDALLNISCIECSGPRMPELTSLFASSDGSQAFVNFTNGVFDFVSELIEGSFMQVTLDRALNDARKKCPHSVEYEPNFNGFKYESFEQQDNEGTVTFLVAMLVVALILFVAVLAVAIATRLFVRRRHRKWVTSLPRTQLQLLWKEQNKQDEKNAALNEATTSMFNSSALPKWSRWGIPIILLMNIGFFLSGHLSLGASVVILASIGGETFTEDGFFEISIAKSTVKIWEAGGQELAILIFIASFLWPYTKQLITLVLWFMPTSRVPVSLRGSILLWFDVLAKWSMIDVFVLIVTIVSFRVSVKSPTVDFLPPDFYSLDLLVAPKWGLYAMVLAQIICQVSSHVIIHFHRRIITDATTESDTAPDIVNTRTALMDDDDNEIEQTKYSIKVQRGVSIAQQISTMSTIVTDETRVQLCHRAFRRPHRGESDKLIARRAVSPVLVFLSGCVCVLVVVGCFFPSYSLNALGIVGILVESGQEFAPATKDYSVFTTMFVLFEQARLTGGVLDFIGLGGLSFLMIFSVLIVPIVQSTALMVQWFTPMAKKRRHRLSVFLEILHAWQYTEVYLLAILVGAWQLGPISQFMINPYCKSFSGFFAELAYYGLIKEEDAQCFRTDVMVEPTFLFLVGAAIALALLNSFVMSSTSQFFHDCDRYQIVCVQEQTDGDVEYLDDFIEFEESFQSDTARKQTIHPVPVLFTDRYRWFLHREDAVPSRRPSETLGSIGQDTPSDERISPNGNVSTMSPGGYDSDERSSCVEESEHGRLNDAWSEQDFDFDQSTRMSNMGDQTDGDIVTIHGQADMSTVSGNVTVDDPQTFSLASTSSTSSRRLRL